MDNLYNSFFISFLALKPLMERPWISNFIIPVVGFSYNKLEAYQINQLRQDSIEEYVSAIRRHMLNDIVICYERYASFMYVSHENNHIRQDPALNEDRTINSSKFENLENLYVEQEKLFLKQLKRLRNSIVHFNGVYSKTNPLDYTFNNNKFISEGHEGENIKVDLDTIMYIYQEVYRIVSDINQRYFVLYA